MVTYLMELEVVFSCCCHEPTTHCVLVFKHQ
jgi:hypothetical protein